MQMAAEQSMGQRIALACRGRKGNMSKRNAGESDAEFVIRLVDLAMKDIRQKTDVYVASAVSDGIAGFYVEAGGLVEVEGFVKTC